MKKIAVGDLGEFWYGDYKEPFEQLEGGVPGHPVGVVLKADDGKLLCAWCGWVGDNLASHVRMRHKMSARSYKEEVGLLQKSALVSEKVRGEMIAVGLRNRGRMSQLGSYQVANGGLDFHGKRNTKGREAMYTPEHLNKNGRCYEQTLVVARSLASKGQLTERQLSMVGIGPGTIRHWFGGGMNELRNAVGMKEWRVRRYTDRELIGLLRTLAAEIGRTPAESDIKRFGLPTTQTYRSHFGSYPEACRLAGLDPNLPIPNSTDLDLKVMTTYAVTGNIKKVIELLHIDYRRTHGILSRYGFPFPPYYHGPGRREWAADMARRLAGTTEDAA